MELWIRSQSKEDLIKVSNIRSYDNEICTDYGYLITLGNYKTTERALEVLDEIQRILTPKIMLKYNDDFTMSVSSIEQQPTTYVYEMPEE